MQADVDQLDTPPTAEGAPTSEADAVLAGAVEVARAALLQVVAAGDVGDHVEVRTEGELAVAHLFRSTVLGYAGWVWSVTLTRAPGDEQPTVCEVVQLPGDGALLPPPWVPWSERLQPGDLGPGDLLPTRADDPRLAPGYAGDGWTDETDGSPALHWELGLGRARVLSRDGRLDAADRWYDGAAGPDTPLARQAPAPCSTCGFWLPLAGSLGRVFGACGNALAPDDRAVVAADHGCGAHSEALVMASDEPTSLPPVRDEEPALGDVLADDIAVEDEDEDDLAAAADDAAAEPELGHS